MSKGSPNTLIYHLPEDKDELRVVLNAHEYLYALQELDEQLRRLSKYQDEEWAEKARDLLREVLKERGIEI